MGRGVTGPCKESGQSTDILLAGMGRPRFSWGSISLVDAGETRQAYIDALRSADNHDIHPLLDFVRN